MPSYRVRIDADAEAEFLAVPFPFRRQLNQRIVRLKEEPRPPDAERLSAEEKFRLRVHGWRVLYEVDDEALAVRVLGVARAV